MVFGICFQRERLFKFLYIVHTFLLAGTVCYYFQGSVEKTAPDHDIAGEPSQPIGETLRPVWGPMDKCYPVTTQRRRVQSGTKPAPKATISSETGGPSDAAPKEASDILSQDEGAERSPAEEAASPIPAGKEVAGTPSSEGSQKVQEETAVRPPEASEAESKEDTSRRALQPLRELWLSWFPGSDHLETQNQE